MTDTRSDAVPSPISLARLNKGAKGVVIGVRESPARTRQQAAGEAEAAMTLRLIEIGFVAGERFEIVAVARPGGDPLAVRIGASLFALRRREAEAILVQVGATAPVDP